MAELTHTKEEILTKAEEFSKEYETKYGGCAQSTFYAVTDALRWGGLEVISPELQDKMYAGVCLLSGGGCFSAEGTCGAVVGSILAGGFASGLSSSTPPPSIRKAGGNIRNSLVAKYNDEFGSILCKDVMRKYYGKAWDLSNDKMSAEFKAETDGCVIRKTAVWMTDILLDMYEKGELQPAA